VWAQLVAGQPGHECSDEAVAQSCWIPRQQATQGQTMAGQAAARVAGAEAAAAALPPPPARSDVAAAALARPAQVSWAARLVAGGSGAAAAAALPVPTAATAAKISRLSAQSPEWTPSA